MHISHPAKFKAKQDFVGKSRDCQDQLCRTRRCLQRKGAHLAFSLGRIDPDAGALAIRRRASYEEKEGHDKDEGTFTVMSNIDELQRRITAAMDRVALGVDKLGAGSAGPDPEMAQALEDERTANAQLTERVRALKTKSDSEMATMRTQVEESDARMAQLDIELQRVRRANAQLSDACAALRDANEEGVGDPHLINKAMLAELEGLRAARAADVAEATAILSALTPLVDGASAEETA